MPLGRSLPNDNKISDPHLLSWNFSEKKKKRFGQIFCNVSPSLTPSKTQILLILSFLETQQPSQNPEITARLPEQFRKVRANFCLTACETSQETDGNCSEKLVHMNFFILGGFFRVAFPPVSFGVSDWDSFCKAFLCRDSLALFLPAMVPLRLRPFHWHGRYQAQTGHRRGGRASRLRTAQTSWSSSRKS